MRLLFAEADHRAMGGAEAYAAALANCARDMGHEVGTIDIRGHRDPGGRHHRPPWFVPGRSLWNWALVCRALPSVAAHYDRVITVYGEGPPTAAPQLSLRHAPVLFSTRTADLANIGARPTVIRRAYVRLCRKIAGELSTKGPTVVANSQWTADRATGLAGAAPRVLYPPLQAPRLDAGATKDPYLLVALGRITPSKRLEDAITVLRDLRRRDARYRLHILGRGGSAYARRFVRHFGAEPGLKLSVDATDFQRTEVLSRATFGLHMFNREHFGIAVAEMICAGVLPFVGNAGGVVELVTTPGLRFKNPDEVPQKLIKVAENPAWQAALIGQLQRGPALAAALDFDARARRVLDGFCRDGVADAA